ncbi:hypothetical protein OHA72_27595 [Dactylosporangium sp. NBC_01737]|uniref:hypothetical protein n=1 Tax=Dactylosporangium sp. NBC_01737 TaxID=2975959 RepID=UPI002E12808E|nr:hypothetical protein OHA72_27595 [Dactylosporangium sp. NBC_01737]
MTEIVTGEGKLYLATVIDLYSPRIPPRQPPTAIRVEELRHDRTMTRDEFLGRIPLPPPRRRPLLKIRRRHPPVEREPQATYFTRPSTASLPGGACLIEPRCQ